MRKTLALAISAGLGFSAIAGIALADRGHGMFGRVDANGDGFVSKDEFGAGRTAMFAKLDANGDGAVDQPELDKAREAFHQHMRKPADAAGHARHDGGHHGGFLKRSDADGDGKVTAQEFTAAGDRMFARLDDNGDGRIAKGEMPSRHRKDAPAESAPAQ
jgi:Ca2+-binding EF-hand superfamily protein